MEENLGEKLCQLGQRILETARNELYRCCLWVPRDSF